MDPAAPASPEPDALPEPPASPRARSSTPTPTDPDATLRAYQREVDCLLDSVPSPVLSQADCFFASSNYQRSVAYGRAGTEAWMTRVEGSVSSLPERARRFVPTPAPPPPPPPPPQPQSESTSTSKSKAKSKSKSKSKKRPRSPAPNEDEDEDEGEGDDLVKTEPEAGAGERKKAKTGESSTGDGPEELGRGMRACAGRAAGTPATPAPEQ
ncbi:hypothetical protein JCM1841_006902 [Sporobolomyces salmonicolor]